MEFAGIDPNFGFVSAGDMERKLAKLGIRTHLAKPIFTRIAKCQREDF
jgi:hypothetical protein